MAHESSSRGESPELATLQVGTGWVALEARTDPYVRFTWRGYAPAIDVEVLEEGHVKRLFVAAKSLAERLEEIRSIRGTLEGAQFRIRRETTDKFAAYLFEELGKQDRDAFGEADNREETRD
jgi:hypothetical protein